MPYSACGRSVCQYVDVADKPGEGTRVLAALKEGGVNLLAFTAFPTGGGRSQIDVVASSGDVAAAAQKAGLKVSAKKQAFFIQGDDRPGAAAEWLKKLADAKINVTATNATCGGRGDFGLIVWVKASDVDAAAKALGAS